MPGIGSSATSSTSLASGQLAASQQTPSRAAQDVARRHQGFEDGRGRIGRSLSNGISGCMTRNFRVGARTRDQRISFWPFSRILEFSAFGWLASGFVSPTKLNS
jgi:hypothetical protein